MRHDDQGARADRLLELAQEHQFRLRVHRAGRFVHQQNLRLRHQAARQRHQLALAARQHVAHLADRQLPALRVGGDHPVQPGETRDVGELQRVDAGAAHQHVVAQRAVEQARFLRDESDFRAKVGRVDLTQVDAVGEHPAFAGLVQRREQPQHGRLAAADAPQNRNPFARLERQVDAFEHARRLVAFMVRVGKAQVGQRDAPAQAMVRHIGLAGLALGGQGHQPVERHHRGARALVARGQAHHAAERRHCTAGEHHRADQRAAGDHAVVDQVDAPHQHHDGDELLRCRRDVVRPARQAACAQRGLGGRGGGGFVAVQEAALSAGRLQVFQPFDRFDQHALQVGLLRHVGTHGAAQPPLDDRRHAQDERNRDHHHPAQRAAGEEDHRDEQNHERQVADGRQRRRGKEVAHHFHLRQVVRVRARRRRSVLHAHAQGLAEQQRADDQVGLAPRHVDQVAAQLARQQVEQQGQQGAAGQRPQRHEGLVRNHLVVHHRDHQADHQHQHVAHQRGQQGRAVIREETPQRAPQPVAVGVAQQAVVGRAGGQRHGRRRDEGEAGVLGLQFRFMRLADHRLGTGHDDFIAVGVGFEAAHQDAGVAILEQQHRRQQQGMNFTDAALDQAGGEAGLAHRADRLVRPHGTGERQLRQQRLRGAFPAMVAR